MWVHILCLSLAVNDPHHTKYSRVVGGQALEMEVDTGASLSVISEGTYKNLVSENRAPPLEKSELSFVHT